MRIDIDIFDSKSINAAVKMLNRYANGIAKAAEEIARRLAEIGVQVVDQSYSFTGEAYTVRTEQTENGYMLIAEGDNVVFLEFGTGVLTEDYEHPNASGLPVISPGSWSQTEGMKHFIPGVHEYWYYNRKKYSGTIATQGFYFAKKEMKEQAKQIAAEEFHKWLR